jgi:hypothetical protein
MVTHDSDAAAIAGTQLRLEQGKLVEVSRSLTGAMQKKVV